MSLLSSIEMSCGRAAGRRVQPRPRQSSRAITPNLEAGTQLSRGWLPRRWLGAAFTLNCTGLARLAGVAYSLGVQRCRETLGRRQPRTRTGHLRAPLRLSGSGEGFAGFAVWPAAQPLLYVLRRRHPRISKLSALRVSGSCKQPGECESESGAPIQFHGHV
jgi:hypothetical protein